MNLKINHVPKDWDPYNYLSFLKWMEKIQSINYHKIK